MMVYFTVEEENLICVYCKADRRRTMDRMTAALPDMDGDYAGIGPADDQEVGGHDGRRL